MKKGGPIPGFRTACIVQHCYGSAPVGVVEHDEQLIHEFTDEVEEFVNAVAVDTKPLASQRRHACGKVGIGDLVVVCDKHQRAT